MAVNSVTCAPGSGLGITGAFSDVVISTLSGGTVTNVTGNAPITSTGGAAPAIGISATPAFTSVSANNFNGDCSGSLISGTIVKSGANGYLAPTPVMPVIFGSNCGGAGQAGVFMQSDWYAVSAAPTTITFPQAFPHGIITLQLSLCSTAGGPYLVGYVSGSATTSSIQIYAVTTAGAYVATVIFWTAYGY